jgi:low density lipoprotein receptor-related protein 5/6
MYWIDDFDASIHRANLDGSEMEAVLVTKLDEPTAIAIDTLNAYLYWAESGKIMRVGLDGSGTNVVVDLSNDSRSGAVGGLALDFENSKLYWTNLSKDKIQRSNLDGSSVEDVITDQRDPSAIVVDPESDMLLFTGIPTSGGYIRRANLDGSNIENMVTGLYLPYGLAFDTENKKILWTDMISNDIQRANPDGSAIEEVLAEDLDNPTTIVLDASEQKLYFIDKGRGSSGWLWQRIINRWTG